VRRGDLAHAVSDDRVGLDPKRAPQRRERERIAREALRRFVAGANLREGLARLLAYLASDDGDYVRRNMFTR